MCNFKSFIITKSGDILHTKKDNSHETIIEENKKKYDLRDETIDPKKLLFARVEIIPPNGDIFSDFA